MLKTVLTTFLIICFAVLGGGASVWYTLNAKDGVGAVTIGRWTAFPDIGTPDADPYAKARIAREGVLALGRAEGLTFTAQRDAAGDRLRRECSYVIEGPVPPARFWTLYAADANDAIIESNKLRPAALHSYQLLRRPDNSVAITVEANPSPGNWLALSGSGPMSFVLTFYDTPIASSTGVSDIELPDIINAGCNG